MYKRRPFSMIFFHRRKSLIVKLILVVPITWIIVTTLLSLTEKIGLEKEVDEVVVDVPNLVIEQNIVTVGGDKYEGRKPRQSMEEPPRLSILPHIGLDTKPEMELNLGNVHEIHADDRPDLAQLAPPREPEGPGEGGKPVSLVNLTEEQQRLVKEGWEKNAFNQYVSDIISLHRYLPDVRPRGQAAGCQEEKYDDDLPPTSVIICFHNEAWSVLLRTVHSVLDRSPPHLIEEVILVDDFSDMPHLGRPLEDYFLHQPKVKVIRARRREGLIRARLMGAAAAKAPILTYLDSHCECAQGWLEPLLQRIANNWTTVVCPVIDVIDDETFEYHFRESGEVNVGGFDWNLQFSWHAMPEREHKRRNHTWDPVWSPTMAGGLFSIDKKFFERLGTYDSGFDIWGGENLELSFKTWMCGGSLEIIPCSHVGHIFRKRSPYKWKTGVNVLRKNSVRLAEVWLDEYKKYYYDRIGNDLGEFGDVTSRLELRKKLQCKSFDWYLKTVYPELYIPGEALGQGENIAYMRRYQAKMITSGADWKFQKNYNKLKTIYQEYAYKDDRCALVIDFRNKFMKIRNLGDGGDTCLDSAAKRDDFHKPIGLWPCHSQGGNQYWMFSKEGEIKRDEACLDYSGGDVILYPCHGAGGNQMWIYDPNLHTIQQTSSRKCMELAPDKQSVLMAPCSGSPRQKWLVQNYDPTKLAKSAS